MRDVLDAPAVRQWCRVASDALAETRAQIDALNVFPVPDSDTGTNLHLTVRAAAEALEALPPEAGAAVVWSTLAEATLYGARGNSGVILSQVMRGLADVLAEAGDAASGAALSRALQHASALAYAAVASPVEGAVLTVLREAANAAGKAADLPGVTREAATEARRALLETTRQLEVLARHGVVDAGGAGLCVLLDVLAAVVCDEAPGPYLLPAPPHAPAKTASPEWDFGYEVMYLLDAPDKAMPGLRQRLARLGDSLVVVGGNGVWNVHVHVDDAGAAIEAGLAAGRPHRIRVTYLRPAEVKDRASGRCGERGVVALTASDGLAALLRACGASVVAHGEDAAPDSGSLASAITAAGDEVIVIPDDPVVLEAAEAAAAEARAAGARVSVIPARAPAQGLAALAVHDAARPYDDDVAAMADAAGAVRYGHVEAGPPGFQAFAGDGPVHTGTAAAAARDLLADMLSAGGELVTLIAGADAPEGLTKELSDLLRVSWPAVEVVVYDAGTQRHILEVGIE